MTVSLGSDEIYTHLFQVFSSGVLFGLAAGAIKNVLRSRRSNS